MDGDINYEKKVDAYRDGLVPEEIALLDSINAELTKNVFSESGKTDTELLNIKDGFDLYGQESKVLFGKDIKTFSDKEVWQKFHKLKYDIEKRGFLPIIASDRENKEKKLSLDDLLNGNYTGIDSMLNSNDETQKRFCLNFVKDIARYRGLSTNIRKDVMKKINDTMIEKISTNTGLAKEIEGAMSYLYENSDQSQEILNLSYGYFIKLFQGLPTHISKQIISASWLTLLVVRANDLQEPNNINNLLKIVEDKLDLDMLTGVYGNLLAFDIHTVSIETTISNVESIILNAFPNNIQSLSYLDSLFVYVKRNNQIDKLQQTLSTFSEAKRATFVYALLCSAQYGNDQEMFGFVDNIMKSDQGTRDVVKVLISGVGSQGRRDIHLSMYNRFFKTETTDKLDASDVKQTVINKVNGQVDPYAYQVLRYAGVEIAGLNIKTMLINSKNLIQDIQILESNSLSISDINWLNELIQQQPTEEARQKIWFECIINSPNELIGKLLSFDTNKIFGFDKNFFDVLYAHSPDRQDKQKLMNDLMRLSELIKETGNIDSTKDLFDTYNLTNYRRYSKRLLKHMVENKDKPTGKPIFSVFMTKRDHNGAFESVLNDNGELEKMLTEFDIRAFEPGDDTEGFFGDNGILEKFHTEYVARGGKRENVNSMIGMHGNQSLMQKSKSLQPSEYITLQDKDLFTQLSKYLKGGTLSLLSCSTGSNSNGAYNIAQSAAKSVHCRVMAPHNDSNLESIVYNKSGGIEFTNYMGDTSTVIYDGREDLESKEDILEIDKDIIENIDVLVNDGLGARDFELTIGTFGDVVIEKTDIENKRKVSNGSDIIFLEKKQNNGIFELSIDATGSENGVIEIPYTAFSKWLPKRIVDSQGNSSLEENNFRVESDSTIKLNIIKSKTGVEENKINEDKIYNKGKNILIDIQEYSRVKGINIYDITGKLVKDIKNINENHLELNMDGSPSGVYIVSIIKDATSSSTKIILP